MFPGDNTVGKVPWVILKFPDLDNKFRETVPADIFEVVAGDDLLVRPGRQDKSGADKFWNIVPLVPTGAPAQPCGAGRAPSQTSTSRKLAPMNSSPRVKLSARWRWWRWRQAHDPCQWRQARSRPLYGLFSGIGFSTPTTRGQLPDPRRRSRSVARLVPSMEEIAFRPWPSASGASAGRRPILDDRQPASSRTRPLQGSIRLDGTGHVPDWVGWVPLGLWDLQQAVACRKPCFEAMSDGLLRERE